MVMIIDSALLPPTRRTIQPIKETMMLIMFPNGCLFCATNRSSPTSAIGTSSRLTDIIITESDGARCLCITRSSLTNAICPVMAQNILQHVGHGTWSLLVHCTDGVSRSGAVASVPDHYRNFVWDKKPENYEYFKRVNPKVSPTLLWRRDSQKIPDFDKLERAYRAYCEKEKKAK